MLACLGLAGNLEAAALLQSAVDGDTAAALERLDRLYAGGKEMTALAGELSALVRDLLVRKTAPRTGAALMTGGFDAETMKKLSARLDVPRLAQMLGRLQRTAAELVRSANRRTDMELCLLALCDPELDDSPAGLNVRLTRLEQGGGAAPAPKRERPPAPKQEQAPEPRREAPPEDTVPWEEEPPLPEEPPMPEEEPPVGQAPGPEPSPKRMDSPAPPAGGGSWPGWSAFCARLKGTLAVSDYTFVNNAAMTQGRWDGRELTLWAANDFLRDMLDKTSITRPITELLQRVTGVQGRVSVKVGAAPPEEAVGAPAGPDALDAFLAQGGDNIIIE